MSADPGPTDDRSAEIDALLFEYIDRLNAGEILDPEAIEREQPELAHTLIERLEVYRALGQPATPLGTLGDYTLRRQIGRGGMGVVYEAWENSMDRAVALKVLPAGIAADAKASARFLREAQTAGKLNHENIVRVYSTGVREGTPWYSMEYVEGETLAQILARVKDAEPETETPFGLKDTGDYFIKLAEAFAHIADGLQHAHSKGIIHRDIKPSNLILDADGRLRILDFGLARLEGQESLTLSGDFLGTPLYMSPEQARRKKVPIEHRTDVYSLGATAYEALTGRPPFRGEDYADTLSQIIERDPVSPREVCPRVPVDLETIVLKCLRKDPGDRYGTAEALAQDLRRFAEGRLIEARSPTRLEVWARRIERHRGKIAAWSVVVVLVALVATLGSLLWIAKAERDDAEYGRLVHAGLERLLRAETMYGRGLVSSGVRPRHREDPAELFLPGDPKRFLGSIDPLGDAISRLESAAAIRPDRVEAHYYLARAFELGGGRERARNEVERALRIDGAFPPALSLLEAIASDAAQPAREETTARNWSRDWFAAAEAVADGQWLESAKAYRRLIDLDSARDVGDALWTGASIETRMKLGLVLLEAGEYWQAAETFVEVRSRHREFLQPWLLIGRAYFLDGRPDAAKDTFEDLHAQAWLDVPDEARFWIASTYKALGDYEAALTWTRKIEEAALSERLETHMLWELRRYPEAIALGEKVLARDPNDTAALLALGWSLYYNLWGRAGPRVEAEKRRLLEVAREVERQASGNHHATALLGVVHQVMGDVERAVELCKKSIAMGPDDTTGYVNLAMVYYHSGDTANGMATIQECLERGIANENVYFLAGLFTLSLGEDTRAVEYMDRAVEINPLYAWHHWTLGWILVRQGKRREAIAHLETAARLWPKIAHKLLAQQHRKLGDLDRALEVVEEGLRFDDDRPALHLEKGRILEARGELAGAARAWVRALDLDPTQDSLRAALVNLFSESAPPEVTAAAAGLLPTLRSIASRSDDAALDEVVSRLGTKEKR